MVLGRSTCPNKTVDSKQPNNGADAQAHYQQEEESPNLMTEKTSSKKNNRHTSGPNTRWKEHAQHVNIQPCMPRT